MSSRNSILAALRENQPEFSVLPDLNGPISVETDPAEKFKTLATAIGSRIFEVSNFDQIIEVITKQFSSPARIISSFQELAAISETDIKGINPHLLEDTELAILKAQLGVAENGSMWVPELNMMERALPFICQHLALVVNKKDIVSNMHEAYQILGTSNTGFGAFIAGPSKTADIEQSLVLGAHGPRSMTVFIMS